ncbi:MAG: tRNA threonylcarbamoyladenosine dehydratase [Firmicutes bacterium]|nr:tRNA threonylcarbamoyladenosine dehydratase [Bacillota bacterium]
MDRFERTQNLIGIDNLEKLKNKSIIVFGIGGVGSFVAEAAARCGIGKITLVDGDKVTKSNINRQLVALTSTIGKPKVSVMAERIRDINPDCQVTEFNIFYNSENDINLSQYDYIIDAIDTVTSKLILICEANRFNIPIISCMGTGNKLDASRFEIADISKTSVCPLAKVMRRELKKREIYHLKVLYSKEEPKRADGMENPRVPSSISFVPPVAGMLIAGEMVRDLIKSSS